MQTDCTVGYSPATLHNVGCSHSLLSQTAQFLFAILRNEEHRCALFPTPTVCRPSLQAPPRNPATLPTQAQLKDAAGQGTLPSSQVSLATHTVRGRRPSEQSDGLC